MGQTGKNSQGRIEEAPCATHENQGEVSHRRMITRKKTTIFFNAALITIVALLGVSSAQIKLKRLPGGEEAQIAGFQRDNTLFVSLTGFCDAEGFAWKWNPETRKLTCIGGKGKITFAEDNPFYLVNDSVFQSPSTPLLAHDSLFLPAGILVNCFRSLEKETIEWSAKDSSIIISSAPVHQKTHLKDAKTKDKSKDTAEDASAKQATSEQIIKTIVIDPGHGGKDPGAIGQDGFDEKDIVLSIGLKLRDMLKKKSLFRFS
jgi:N-acetylmuramoyl-L-alanine amidase